MRHVLSLTLLFFLNATLSYSGPIDNILLSPVADETLVDTLGNQTFIDILARPSTALFARIVSSQPGEERAVFEFDISEIPPRAVIREATFNFRVTGNHGTEAPTSIHSYAGDGVVSTQDAFEENPFVSESMGVFSNPHNYDVSEQIQSLVDSQENFAGFLIRNNWTSINSGIIIARGVAASLSVAWDPPPIIPVHGFVDTHNHLLNSKYIFGGAWSWGDADGPIHQALRPCDGGDNHARLSIPKVFDFLGFSHCNLNLPFTPLIQQVGSILLSEAFGGDTGLHRFKKNGHPDFSGWPSWNGVAHQQDWSGWLRDALNGGMTLMVMSALEMSNFCELMPDSNRIFDCDEMSSLRRQFQAAHDFVAAHSEWVEIALTPSDARRIIHSGKLAIILSFEASHLFENSPDISQAVQEFYDLGVRSFQPIHQLDNRFGGAAHHNVGVSLLQLQESCLLNINSIKCRVAGFNLDDDCKNKVGLTRDGATLIQELMNRNLIIDIAHIGERTVNDIGTITKNNNYYPIFMSHGHIKDIANDSLAHEEKTIPNETVKLIRESGGIFGLRTGPDEVASYEGSGVENTCHGSARSWAQSFSYGEKGLKLNMGISSDINSLAKMPNPRYEFEWRRPRINFGGVPRRWVPKKKDACNAARTKKFRECQAWKEFRKPYNGVNDSSVPLSFDTRGLAHVGLLPQLVEQLENLGTDTTSIWSSSETFIKMWERAYEQRSPNPITATGVNRSGLKPLPSTAKIRSIFRNARSNCRSGRRGCRGSCRRGGRSCRSSCRGTRRGCISNCRDARRNCTPVCNSTKRSCVSSCNSQHRPGRRRRRCKRSCRRTARSCRTSCRGVRRSCVDGCRDNGRSCKNNCGDKRTACLYGCTDSFMDCACAPVDEEIFS